MQDRPRSASWPNATRVLLAWLPTIACVEGPGAERPIPAADFDAYVEDVQPVFDARCGERSCHGNAERPLGLFSPGRRRLDPATDPAAPLEDGELRANFDRARSFLAFLDHPDACELLTKPLAVEEGGVGHAAGAVFTSTIDDEYVDILYWISDAIGDDPG